MLPKSLQPELSHTCAHPGCCSHEAAGAETAAGNPAGALPEHLENAGGSLLGSLKCHVLWSLAFFGIYASSSVCPFCGTPGCPVGGGAPAVMGGVFGVIMAYGKMILNRLGALVFSIRPSH